MTTSRSPGSAETIGRPVGDGAVTVGTVDGGEKEATTRRAAKESAVDEKQRRSLFRPSRESPTSGSGKPLWW
jgi:hypothetical protein